MTEIISHLDINYYVTTHLLIFGRKVLHITFITFKRNTHIFISWTIASHNSVFSFDFSIDIASLNYLGILTTFCECKSNILTLLLRWFDSFFSSQVELNTQMQVPERFRFYDNTQHAEMGSITLLLWCFPMSLIHLSAESKFPSHW